MVAERQGEHPAVGMVRLPGTRDLALAEVGLRHQFDGGLDTAAEKSRPGSSCFVRIDGVDPLDSFMARFVGNEPPVRPGSEFREGTGILFGVLDIAEINATTVEVIASTHSGNLGGSRFTLRLALRGGTWFVTSD